MIGNVIDNRRRDHRTPICDAVFEPSCHLGLSRPDGSNWFDDETAYSDPACFLAKDLLNVTVREAILHAETEWKFPVTIFLYDAGTNPL